MVGLNTPDRVLYVLLLFVPFCRWLLLLCVELLRSAVDTSCPARLASCVFGACFVLCVCLISLTPHQASLRTFFLSFLCSPDPSLPAKCIFASRVIAPRRIASHLISSGWIGSDRITVHVPAVPLQHDVSLHRRGRVRGLCGHQEGLAAEHRLHRPRHHHHPLAHAGMYDMYDKQAHCFRLIRKGGVYVLYIYINIFCVVSACVYIVLSESRRVRL